MTSTKRIPANVLAADRQHVLTIQSLGDYNPRNPIYSTANLQMIVDELDEAEEAEVLIERSLEMARERAIEVGIRLHTRSQGLKSEVVAQYGEDSPAVHAIGRKQKSERRRPSRRKTSLK